MINEFTPIYLLAIYGLVRVFAKTNPKDKKGQVNWSVLETVSVALALYFGAQIVAGIALAVVAGIKGIESSQINNWANSSTGVQFGARLIIEFVIIWGLRSFLRRRQADFKTIGLIKPRASDIVWALIGFAIYFLSFIAVLQLVKGLVPSIDLSQKQDIGFGGAEGANLSLVFISLVVLPPLVEEILMRGFLFTSLKKHLPKAWAVIITSVLFAVAHLQIGNGTSLIWIAALDTLILSFVLIYLREKTGGLWASIGLHGLKNFIAFLALFVFIG